MDFEIRAAAYSDAEELQSYASRLFTEDLPGIFKRPIPTVEDEIAFIRAHLDPWNSTLLVAVAESRIVGLLDFTGFTLDEERHVGTFGLSVDAGHRGLGIGTALIDELVRWAPSHGISRIQAWAWSNNPGAVALYERMGFAREGLCRNAIIRDGHAIDVWLMARLLTPHRSTSE